MSPDAIVFEILTRLPAKAVWRFKVVCKEWCHLLSTRQFEKVHSDRSLLPSKQKTLVIRDLIATVHPIDFATAQYGPGTTITCPFYPDITGISILSHMDGLLCAWVHDTHELFLWNPTTTTYKTLSNSNGRGIFVDSTGTIAFFKDHLHDYKVMHVIRNQHAFEAHVYSRLLACWTEIPFPAKLEYLDRKFSWSTGTQCGATVYYTITQPLIRGKNVIIAFDTFSGHVTELQFPPIQTNGVLETNMLTVQDALYMFVTNGLQERTLQLWILRQDHWINVFTPPPIPPISERLWCSITHYMTNGKWFVMTNSHTLYEIDTDMRPLQYFHTVNSLDAGVGAVYLETVVAPDI
ncbi:F-box/kelch-repeat protein At3g23880-like [Bidens hawaiensis]|uniref:F-box/kelch-repeat protein At3g23880-like n=1 Tax=Bidens hawaiensis TaxID=980011 RepID=UPI0040491552